MVIYGNSRYGRGWENNGQDDGPSGSQEEHRPSGSNEGDQHGDNERSPSDEGNKDKEAESEGNKDEEQQDSGPPTPVGFWDQRLAHVRKEAITKWAITTVGLMTFILAVLSIYWGSLLHAEQNLSSLVVYVVDMDGQSAPYDTNGHQPIVGPLITNMARTMVASKTPTLGWGPLPGSAFNNDPVQVRQAVFNFQAWAAITINPNATAMLYSAIENGNASYDPMGACQLTYLDSRDETNWYDFIFPQISSFMTEATSMVGEQWTQMVLQNATNDATLLTNVARVPQALSPAIGFSQFNLRPFYPYQIIPSVSIGLIYLIILSFFSFAFYLPIHFKVAIRSRPRLKRPPPSLRTPILTHMGMEHFLLQQVYWMLNFVGMIALGLACENVAMIVGQPWTGLWLIFWVITNVSTAFYDIDLEPAFYRYGYAWPLHSIVEGSRQILFGQHSRLGLDFGILIAWGAVNTVLFPFACYFMRWKSKHHVHEYYK
ncbi:hypothetical protein LTS10_000534 [Elasticomyces elasticus]|nr:hypothetical protein LTS10_000534 [Elasticomyces elasticus]